MTRTQGGGKVTPSHRNWNVIVHRVHPWQQLDENAVVRQRLLVVLERNPQSRGQPSTRAWSWWEVRQAVGGRCSSRRFREIVDVMICDGEILEVWEAMPDRRQPRHRLVATHRWNDHIWGDLIEVRGRRDTLAELGLDDGGS